MPTKENFMATITLTINAESALDLVNEIRNLQAAIGMQITKHEQVATEIKTAATPTAKATKPRTETKPKPVEAKEEPVETKVEEVKTTEVKAEETAPTSAFSKDDVAHHLGELSAAKGMKTAKEVLARFTSKAGVPCVRMSDIQEKDYEDFINTCKAEASA